MARKKVTYALDEDLVKRLRTRAVHEDKPDYQVVEDALRTHLDPFAIIDKIREGADMDPDEAMELALRLSKEVRQERYEERLRRQAGV